MAFLKVIFPHHDDNGRYFAAGDYREVADHLVEVYQKPYPGIGIVVMAADERTVISNVAATMINHESSLEEELQSREALKEQEVVPEEAPVEETSEGEVAEPRGRKRKG